MSIVFQTAINKLPPIRGEYRQNYSLAQSSWFGCGGACAVLFKPQDADDLQHFLQNYDKSIKIVTIGALSNTIIRDGGFDGVVIKLGRGFSTMDIQNNILRLGSSALDYNIANFAMQNGVCGLEFLIGIPGTIGGNIIMNAGCYGGEICDVFSSATGFDLQGNYKVFTKKNAGFGYRHSNITDTIITSVDLIANFGDVKQIEQKMNQIRTQREQTQPLKQKTCGSTFANPTIDDVVSKGDQNMIVDGVMPKSWQLVKSVLDDGFRVGGAFFSPKHYNFMINDGTATATDIETLGSEIKNRVLQKHGINLRWEIGFIGNKAK